MPIYSPYAGKPPLGAPIDWSRPLSRGLLRFFAFNVGSISSERDDVSGLLLAPAGTLPTVASGPDGIAYAFSSGARFSYLETANPSQFSVVVRVLSTAPTNGNFQTVFGRQNGTPGLYIQNGAIDFLAGSQYRSAASSIVADTWYTVAVTYDGATISISLNGGPPITSSASSITGWNTTLYMGSDGSNILPGSISWLGFWGRCLSSAEVSAAAVPWGLYGSRRSYFLSKPAGVVATKVRRSLYDRAGSRGVA